MKHLLIGIFMCLGEVGTQAYDTWKIRQAFLKKCHPGWSWGVLAFLELLLFAPAWSRLFWEHGEQPAWLMQSAWIWMLLSFWIACMHLAVDIWNFCIPKHKASVRCAWCLALAYVVFSSVWGVIEANSIIIKRLDFASPKIPASADGYQIALATDIHVGTSATASRVAKTVAMLNSLQADLVLSGGDLVDGKGERERAMYQQIAQIQAPAGHKIACMGNHEIYTGIEPMREFHKAADFELLEGQGKKVEDWLWIFCAYDPHFKEFHPELACNAPVQPPADTYNIMLQHDPGTSFGHLANYDLQLSGHTHGGQIFPGRWMVAMKGYLPAGVVHQVSSGCQLYISPGAGFWGPPFRILARPEIVLITLHHAN